jgi:hypothetical protein
MYVCYISEGISLQCCNVDKNGIGSCDAEGAYVKNMICVHLKSEF